MLLQILYDVRACFPFRKQARFFGAAYVKFDVRGDSNKFGITHI
jgi:hypothetical protein